jgi:hypothetical protein
MISADDFHVCGYKSLFVGKPADEGTSETSTWQHIPKDGNLKISIHYLYTSDVFGASETSLPRI